MVLHLLLLGSASALHPDIRRLESLALQQFGHRQLASFKEANRQLNEMVGTSTDPTSSANNGDISSMCANEQFLQFCSMNDAQLEQTVATSANDGAANGGASDAAANVCALKAMQGFYCNTLCEASCEAFLSAGGDGEALSQSSANDAAAGGGSSSSDATPSFMSDTAQLDRMCSNDCLKNLLTSVSTMIDGLAACGGTGGSGSLSGNDGAAGGGTGAGTGAATQTDPTAAIEDMLGQVCVKNGGGKYCAGEFAAFTAKHPEPPAALSCESAPVKELLGLGCCFGSVVAMAALAPADTGTGSSSSAVDGSGGTDGDGLSEMQYWVTRCGGSARPCTDGAVKDIALVTSTVSLSAGAGALTAAALESPAAIAALRKHLADSVAKPEPAVLINKVTVSSSSSGSSVRVRGRALEADAAEVSYSVMVGSGEAGAVEASIRGMDGAALTSKLAGDAAFKDVPSLSAAPSRVLTTDVSKASPDGSGDGGGNAGHVVARRSPPC